MVGKATAPPGYVADRITRGADHIVVWPRPDLLPGDAVWIDEAPEGGFVVKGIVNAFLGLNDQLNKLWYVTLEDSSATHVVPEQLLRKRD